MVATSPLSSLKVAKRIADPVHGLIKLNSLESKVLQHPSFQRLRDITQLGIAKYVFPGASHNRFSHSLGMLHNVTAMYDAAYRNWERNRDVCGDIEADWLFSDDLFQSVRLAALCHDLGHFPFSHNLEKALDWMAESGLIGETYRHERLSAVIIEEMLGSILDQYIPTITGLIEGDYTKTKNSLFPSFLVSSSIDGDRMDYLVRDSLHCGVDHGRIDRNRLLDSIIPYSIKIGGRQHDVLGFQAKGIEAMEQFLLARHRMHQIVYFNPSVVGFEAGLRRAYYRISREDPPWDLPDVYLDDPHRFLKFDEAEFFNQLKKELKALDSWLYDPIVKRMPLTKFGPFFFTRTRGRKSSKDEREMFQSLTQMQMDLEDPAKDWNNADHWVYAESMDQTLVDSLPRLINRDKDGFEDAKNLKNVIFLVTSKGKLIDPTSIDYGHTFLPFISGHTYYRFLFFCHKNDAQRLNSTLQPLLDQVDEQHEI
jgi:HD superfamily phosphohydrolase